MSDQSPLILRKHDLNLQNAITSNRIKYTAISVSPSYLVCGANTGSLYIFRRANVELLRLISNLDVSDPIHLVQFSPIDEDVLSFATTKIVYILKLNLLDRGAKEKILLKITDHKATISCLHWSPAPNTLILYSADIHGAVNMSDVNKFGFIKTSLLFDCGATVVQLDSTPTQLLFSSTKQLFIIDFEKTQMKRVGKTERDGGYGGCFHPSERDRLLGARPGKNLWVAVVDSAIVESTIKFQAAFTSTPHTTLSTRYALAGPKIRTKDIQFGKLIRFRKFVISWDESSLILLDPRQGTILEWHVDIRLQQIAVLDNLIYFLHCSPSGETFVDTLEGVSPDEYIAHVLSLIQSDPTPDKTPLWIYLAGLIVLYSCSRLEILLSVRDHLPSEPPPGTEETFAKFIPFVDRLKSEHDRQIAEENARKAEELRQEELLKAERIKQELAAQKELEDQLRAQQQLEEEERAKKLEQEKQEFLRQQAEELRIRRLELDKKLERDRRREEAEARKRAQDDQELQEIEQKELIRKQLLHEARSPQSSSQDLRDSHSPSEIKPSTTPILSEDSTTHSHESDPSQNSDFIQQTIVGSEPTEAIEAIKSPPKKLRKRKRKRKGQPKFRVPDIAPPKIAPTPAPPPPSTIIIDQTKGGVAIPLPISGAPVVPQEPPANPLRKKQDSGGDFDFSQIKSFTRFIIPDSLIPLTNSITIPESLTSIIEQLPTIRDSGIISSANFQNSQNSSGAPANKSSSFGDLLESSSSIRDSDQSFKSNKDFNDDGNDIMGEILSVPFFPGGNGTPGAIPVKDLDIPEPSAAQSQAFDSATRELYRELCPNQNALYSGNSHNQMYNISMSDEQLAQLRTWIETFDPTRPFDAPHAWLEFLVSLCFWKEIDGVHDNPHLASAYSSDQSSWTDQICFQFLVQYQDFVDLQAVFFVCNRQHHDRSLDFLLNIQSKLPESRMKRKSLLQTIENYMKNADANSTLNLLESRADTGLGIFALPLLVSCSETDQVIRFLIRAYPWILPRNVYKYLETPHFTSRSKLEVYRGRKVFITYVTRLLQDEISLRSDEDLIYHWIKQCIAHDAPTADELYGKLPNGTQVPVYLAYRTNQWGHYDELMNILRKPHQFTYSRDRVRNLCRELGFFPGLVFMECSFKNYNTVSDILLYSDDLNTFHEICANFNSQNWSYILHKWKSVDSFLTLNHVRKRAITQEVIITSMLQCVGSIETMNLLTNVADFGKELPVGIYKELLQAGKLSIQQENLLPKILETINSHLWSHRPKEIAPQSRYWLESELNAAREGKTFSVDLPEFDNIQPLSRFYEEYQNHWGVPTKLLGGCCPTCTLPFKYAPNSVIVFPCGHVYHQNCIPEAACRECFQMDSLLNW